MPTISIFFGFIIQMYWRDHAPPHVHAFYQGFEALIVIGSGEIIAGRLPLAAARMVSAWVLNNKAALTENWARGAAIEPFERIPGADLQ